MLGNEGISVADALALRNTGNDNDGFGGNNGWWIVLLILLFAGGGWGRGWGNQGNDSSNGYNACCTPATMQSMTDAFNFNQLDNSLRGIQNGLCDGFYAMAGNINGILAALQNCCCQTQQSIAELGYKVGSGFCGVDKSILQNDFHNQAGFNASQPKGTYLITMRGHITCCIDGCIYDTFDPSERYIWGIYKVRSKE